MPTESKRSSSSRSSRVSQKLRDLSRLKLWAAAAAAATDDKEQQLKTPPPSAGLFQPVHTPDRPLRLVTPVEAPTEEECLAEIQAWQRAASKRGGRRRPVAADDEQQLNMVGDNALRKRRELRDERRGRDRRQGDSRGTRANGGAKNTLVIGATRDRDSGTARDENEYGASDSKRNSSRLSAVGSGGSSSSSRSPRPIRGQRQQFHQLQHYMPNPLFQQQQQQHQRQPSSSSSSPSGDRDETSNVSGAAARLRRVTRRIADEKPLSSSSPSPLGRSPSPLSLGDANGEREAHQGRHSRVSNGSGSQSPPSCITTRTREALPPSSLGTVSQETTSLFEDDSSDDDDDDDDAAHVVDKQQLYRMEVLRRGFCPLCQQPGQEPDALCCWHCGGDFGPCRVYPAPKPTADGGTAAKAVATQDGGRNVTNRPWLPLTRERSQRSDFAWPPQSLPRFLSERAYISPAPGQAISTDRPLGPQRLGIGEDTRARDGATRRTHPMDEEPAAARPWGQRLSWADLEKVTALSPPFSRYKERRRESSEKGHAAASSGSGSSSSSSTIRHSKADKTQQQALRMSFLEQHAAEPPPATPPETQSPEDGGDAGESEKRRGKRPDRSTIDVSKFHLWQTPEQRADIERLIRKNGDDADLFMDIYDNY